MTRIFGLIPTYNEEHRYLDDCLRHNMRFLDNTFVWDDRSTDNTAKIARSTGATVAVRPESTPSFLVHEGKFRSAGWATFEGVFDLRVGDWILAFDADEFLVSDSRLSVTDAIEKAITRAESAGQSGVILPFPEIFDVREGCPWVRTDGFWGSVRGPRLFTYRPDATWSDKPMGCGSEPTYVSRGSNSPHNYGLHMLHYGYAKQGDQVSKHKRYTSLYDHGHNDKHIQSIIQEPTLVRWSGPVPEVSGFD